VSTSSSPRSSARDVALVAVFAALIAALGVIPAFQPIPNVSPITAQTLGVMLAGSILGARRGALAVLTFLALVAAGLPLLAGGRGGLAAMTGGSAGFLVGWVVGAWVIGYLVERRPARWATGWLVLANAVGGIGIVYMFGVPAMALIGGISIGKATAAAAIYLPGDAIKVAVCAVVTSGVLRGYPSAVPGRESRPKGVARVNR
jgi:biotin transport system substrate-specific component